MKKAMKNKILGFMVLAFSLAGRQACGQEYIPAWKVSVGGGYINYFGDVSPYTIKHWKDWDRVFKFFQYNRYYIPSASFGVSVERYLSPGIAFMVQLNEGAMSMSDRYRKPNGDYDKSVPHWDRALNFKTDIKDAGLAFVFRSNNGRVFPLNAVLAPYFFLGGGITHFNVKGDLYDGAGRPYDYASPAVDPDGIYETELRPLMTETAKKYADIVPYADAGLGLSINMGRRVSLAVQTDIKYAFSDYLDDVSGRYKPKYSDPKSAYAAHPGTNVAGPYNPNRGNNDGVNDFYIFNKLSLSINLGNKADHYFQAPAVYLPGAFYRDTLAPPAGRLSDSSRVSAHRQDTALEDSRRDWQQIRSALLSLRFAHIDQNYIIRQNMVQGRIEALKAESDRLREKADRTEEDSLQVLLAGHEIDSLNRELAAISKARQQLRDEMAYSPIVTEYADSTKIMIYKRHALSGDSAYLPVIGDTLPVFLYDRDTLPLSACRNNRAGEGGGYGRLRPADSLRRQWPVPRREALSPDDSALSRQQALIPERPDHIGNDDMEDTSVPPDSLAEAKEYYIRRDSLQLIELLRRTDSLRRLYNGSIPPESLQKRNAIQRFLDKFRRKGRREDAASYRYEPNLNDTAARYSGDAGSSPERYTPLSRDGSAARLLQQNQEEIDRLQNEINSLRTYTPGYNPPPTVIIRDEGGNDYDGRESRKLAREERRSRRQHNELMAGLTGAMAGSSLNRRQAPASPNIILPPGYGNDNSGSAEQLEDIRRQLDSLKQQYQASDTGNDAWVRRILTDTSAYGNSRLTSALQKKVDSLSRRLEYLTENPAPDSVSRQPDNSLLLYYPTVSLYFATGATTLIAAEKAKIKAVAMAAKKNEQARLLITGFTDGTGNKAVNEAVAHRRANSVRQVLVQDYGLEPGRLVIKTRLAAPGKGANPLSRRADIQFLD